MKVFIGSSISFDKNSTSQICLRLSYLALTLLVKQIEVLADLTSESWIGNDCDCHTQCSCWICSTMVRPLRIQTNQRRFLGSRSVLCWLEIHYRQKIRYNRIELFIQLNVHIQLDGNSSSTSRDDCENSFLKLLDSTQFSTISIENYMLYPCWNACLVSLALLARISLLRGILRSRKL